MKFTVNRVSFLEALAAAGAVASARTPKPVLQCVKITADADRVVLSATDLEVAVRFATGQVQVDDPGEALVPADRFRDIVKASVDDTLLLESKGDQLHVKGADSHFKLNTQDVSDFPPVLDLEGEADFQVKGSVLQRMIGQTIFAAAKEATRYTFNGVLVTVQQQQLHLCATDGRRLALSKGDLVTSRGFEDSGKTIVPAKSLGLLGKIVVDPEATVSVKIEGNQIIFRTDDATLTSNLLEGNFPPYQDVIPKESDRFFTAGKADWLSAVRRASLLTTEDSEGVRMSFSKQGLTISSKSPDTGEATITFAAKYEGADLDIGFSPVFFIDGLKAAESDDVTFELTAANRPGLLKAGSDFLYVIMPINLQ